MAYEFRLPDIGEGMVEGEIVKWYVEEGDPIQEDQPMVEVMTDKATVVIPSPKAGVVLKRYGAEGEIVKVGTVLVVIGEPGEKITEEAVSAPVEETLEMKRVEAPAEKPAVAPAPGKVLATPAVRRLAREHGIDLQTIKGTGPQGRITKEDVLRAVEAQKAPPARVATAPAPAVTTEEEKAREERIPLRGLRRVIARKMVQSVYTAPHYTYVEEVDMSEMVHIREKMKAVAERMGLRLTYLPFIIKAVVMGLKQYPLLNSVLDEERNEIVVKYYYHIGFAVHTDEGLTVPVVHHADRLSLMDIARVLQERSDKARAGKLTPEDIRGSTFTITSLGKLGGLLATPILNYPEVGILGVHKIEPRPVVRDGEIVIRHMMNISVSLDHRVVDGAIGAGFVQVVKEHLENPHLLFLQI